ncbi:MAG: hypothetical protein RL768_2604 [Nitrospirota bacterium]|jgi:hypothetical protein
MWLMNGKPGTGMGASLTSPPVSLGRIQVEKCVVWNGLEMTGKSGHLRRASSHPVG